MAYQPIPVKTDDAAFTPGTDPVVPIAGQLDDTGTDSVDEGDAGALRMSANRNLYIQLRDAAGNERGANVNASNELLVAVSSIPSHAVTNAGTFAVQVDGNALTALQLIDDAVSTTGSAITTKGLAAAGTDGTNARILKTDSSGELQIDVLTLPALAAGTNNIGDVDILSIAAGDNNIGNVDVVTLPAVDATKTVGTSVMALQTVSASSVAISTPVSTGNALGATIFIHFGREAETAAGAGVNIRIEASSKSSGEGHWYPLCIFTTGFAACSGEAVSGTEAAGQTVISVASTTGLTAGDIIFFFNGTIANSEWHRIKSIVAATSVTLEDALVNAQTGSTFYDSAEMFVAQLDLTAVSRLRIVADGSAFTQAFAIEADMITFDSIG